MKHTENVYVFVKDDQKFIINRHYGKLPNDEPSMGMWGVFNIKTGEMIDWSKYRNDLLGRYKVEYH